MLAALAYGIGLTVSVIGVLLCLVAIARDHWRAGQ